MAGASVSRRLSEPVETMMKILTKAALAATVATGLFAAPAFAANSDTQPFTATAKIVKPLTLTNTATLDFGIITMTSTFAGGDVVVSQTGAVTCNAALTCAGTPTAAAFDVTGVANQALAVVVEPVTVLTDSVSSETLAFVPDAPSTISLDSAGEDTFNIGGTITIPASANDGVYSADIDVTVTYS